MRPMAARRDAAQARHSGVPRERSLESRGVSNGGAAADPAPKGETMSRFVLALSLALAYAGSAMAADATGWRKPYFAATTPGAWAQYTMKTEGQADMDYVNRRLPDDAGRQRVQVRVDYMLAGKLTGAITEYTLEPGYSLQDDALGFGKALAAMRIATADTKPVAVAPAVLAGARATMPDYARTAQYVNTENIGGKVSDHYRYTQRYVSSRQIETGEIWLCETVPFGLVKQKAVTRDEAGKVVSRFEMLLADSGVAPAAQLTAAKPAAAGPVTLADAFASGRVELAVYVVPGTGDGRTVRVAVSNKSGAPLQLIIPAGATALAVGSPLETFTVKSATKRTLSIAPGTTAKPIDLAQTGDRRAIDGTFWLTVIDGNPSFRGSVTAGN
jgi:hypothetical protein